MAYRNENGFIRPVNTTTSTATTGTTAGDNDRSVIRINFILVILFYFFPSFWINVLFKN